MTLVKDTMKYLYPKQQEKIVDIKTKTCALYKSEFWSLPSGTSSPATFSAYNSNTDLNRYKNVKCLDATRVQLTTNQYIHANHVNMGQLELILAQGPLKYEKVVANGRTKDATTSGEFLQMIVEKKISHTFMLCNFEENGEVKCQRYFAERVGDSVDISRYRVHTISSQFVEHPVPDSTMAQTKQYHAKLISQRKDLIKREIKIVDKRDGSAYSFLHYQMIDWPDHQDVKNTEAIHHLIKKILKQKRNLLIHCSAGIGRSGTLAAAAIAWDCFKSPDFQSIRKIVNDMRSQRCQVVQNHIQYYMVHYLLIELVEIRRGAILQGIKRKMRIEYDQLKK